MKEDAWNEITNNFMLAYQRQRIARKVIAVLNTFKGKSVSARIKTALEKEFPAGQCINYLKENFSTKIGIWGNGITFDERIYISSYNHTVEELIQSAEAYISGTDEESKAKYEDKLKQLENWEKLKELTDKIQEIKKEAESLGLCSEIRNQFPELFK